jgi:putative phosphoesterase
VKIAVISDVHGNRLALEAVLDDIAGQGVDSTVNLGDHLSGPMEPSWTCDILIEADIPTIAGNHDRMLTELSPYAMGPVDRFVSTQLERNHLTWLRSLPATMSILGDVYMCHGTPGSDTEPWLDAFPEKRNSTLPDEAAVARHAEGLEHQVMLCGHTHIPRVVRLRDGRLIVNPGSIGLQLNHGAPDARYAIVERRNGTWAGTLRSVPYDSAAAARQATANGFPHWTEALTTGWVSHEGLF